MQYVCIKIMLFMRSFYLARPFLLNCQNFFDSCLFIQFPVIKNIQEMITDVLLGGIKQFCNFV